MTNPTSDPTIYTVGGTVQVNEWGVYIPRQADGQLLDLCQQGKFAYVLTPRQMGKSSLMIRTAEQLLDAGSLAVIIDLTQIGTQLTADEWYSDFLSLVADQLMLSTDVKAWWQEHSDSGITLRMTRFFKEVVLTEVSEPITIFVDEIDTTLSLDFTDDFYAAVRFLYVARSTDAELKRLSFVLIGVATPSDLIRDPKRTPFNIGQRVELTDFTATEAEPLGAGLGLAAGLTQQVVGWVLAWTKGHPYLTQRLCRSLLEQPPEAWTEAAVAAGVSRTFFGPMSEQDNNLQFVGDMLTKRAPELLEREVLDVYRQVHRDRVPVWDEEQSLVKSHLKLAGIVWRDGKQLVVRNPIYYAVFNQDWIKDHWPETWWQRWKPAMPLVAGLTLVAMGLGTLSVYALDQRDEATAQRNEAEAQQAEAQKQTALAQERGDDLEIALADAEVARDEAVQAQEAEAAQRNIAVEQKALAEGALADAQAAQVAEAAQRQRAEEGEAAAQAAEAAQRQLTELAEENAAAAQLATAEARTQQQLALGEQLAARADVLQQRADQLPLSTLLAVESIRVLEAQGKAATEAYKVLNQLRLRPLTRPRQLGQDEKGLAISDDSRLLATVDEQGTVRVRDIVTNTEQSRLTASQLNGLTVQNLHFSPDSQYLAIRGEFGVQFWDLQSEQQFSLTEENISSWSFSPDSQYLAIGGEFGGRVWDLQSEQQFSLTEENIYGWRFSPDSQYLAIRGEFGGRVWDLQKRWLMARIWHGGDPFYAWDMQLSPSGRYLLTRSSYQNSAWLIDSDRLVTDACSRLSRNLTQQEWQQYFGDEPYRATCPNLPPAN